VSEIAARVYRGKNFEAVHHASIAVVNSQGELTHYLGDPDELVMTRSSIKPFQVLPLLMTGAVDRYGFSQKQLAIMCGSHVGSDDHREVVLSNLEAAGNTPAMLKCGSHWPLGMQMDNRFPTHEEELDPVRHNCSGKHSGFLALCRFLGDQCGDYLDPESKGQRLVRKVISEVCEYPLETRDCVIDGCSAPNYSVPLRKLALGFQKLATASPDGGPVEKALARAAEAIRRHPEMVSGEKRLDLHLARSFPGNVVNKIGAESVEGIGFAEPPAGIAIKIEDGNTRALGPICVATLLQLGLVANLDNYRYLKLYEQPNVENARKIVTGEIVAEFTLRKA
jgi:L-asparaginase II